MRLLYLHRGEADAVYLKEIRQVAMSQPQLEIECLATGENIPDLRKILPTAVELAGLNCFLCGPPGLVTSARHILLERGVKPDRLHFERFDFRQ